MSRTLAGALLLLLVACAPTAEAPAPVESGTAGGTLVATNLADVDTINDLISNGSTLGRDLERFLFLELVREQDGFQVAEPRHEPYLAERWEFSDDRLTLTFFLRPAVWSDGVEITAEDVRWTFEAQTHPEVAWRSARSKESIELVEVVDERTVRFHFTHSYPGQLMDANRGAILPKHAWGSLPFSDWRSDASWFVEHVVSSGPFVLAGWRPNQEIDLRRNERYYKAGKPRLDRLVIRIVPEKTGQIRQLIGGSVGYVQVVSPDQLGRIRSDPELAVDAYWGRQYDYLCWNLGLPALAEPDVRRALTLAIDRQSIVESVYQGFARVAVSPFLSTTWPFDASLEPWPYDPRAAREALEAAGFVLGADGVRVRDGVRLELDLLVQSGVQAHRDAVTLIQANLKYVGVTIHQRPVEFQTWVERVKAHDFDAAIGGWNIPSSFDMSFAFHTDEIGKYNFGRYSNPELDRVLESAKLETDLEAKRLLFHQIQAILHRDQPYTFLWEPQNINGRDRRLRDTKPNALTSYFNVDEWWIEAGG